jgi:hypothetical protein
MDAADGGAARAVRVVQIADYGMDVVPWAKRLMDLSEHGP